METPLNASATTAGALLSNNTFLVPPFQREYAWRQDEVSEFWSDLTLAMPQDTYFLGLIILTDEGGRKYVVDGQQRILTITMLASAIYHEAVDVGRKALAERINADFLSSIDYETDRMQPRVILSDPRDNRTFQAVLTDGRGDVMQTNNDEESLSPRLLDAYRYLREQLHRNLSPDPFRRLGSWTDFLTNHIYFAVFTHPDTASAYRVFEVINTRGRELTTADLLKNYILSQTPERERDARYETWREISRALESGTASNLVLYIRHVASLSAGYLLPRDLFDYLSGRVSAGGKDRQPAPGIGQLMSDLERWVPLYLQMIDQSSDGPAEPRWLEYFSAFDELNVVSVRPMLMALSEVTDSSEAMDQLLIFVIRKIVVGNLGTGNVERRFSDAARAIVAGEQWRDVFRGFNEMNTSVDEFVEQLRKRSYNKGILAFLRRSLVQQTRTPSADGFLHLIRPRQAPDWDGFPDDEFTYWGSTIGNSMLATLERRPRNTSTWPGFLVNLLPHATNGEKATYISQEGRWSSESVERVGSALAEELAIIWFPEA